LSAPAIALDARQKLFVYLLAVFLTALLIGDTIGSKLFTVDIPLGLTTIHATLSAGAIWFPITFLLTDVVNEFYGAQGARTVTFVGFFMALLAFTIIAIARQIPAAPFSPVSQAAFDTVLGGANRIFVASLCAYLVGQLIDIAVFHRLKGLTQSRHIWLRATGSTLISQLVDTLVVTYVAFGGLIAPEQLRRAAVTSYVVKVMVAIGLTPVIYALHGVIERRLGMKAQPPLERVDLELNP
jgi:queuosine precursor transporter